VALDQLHHVRCALDKRVGPKTDPRGMLKGTAVIADYWNIFGGQPASDQRNTT
jgi:hypothetical protein